MRRIPVRPFAACCSAALVLVPVAASRSSQISAEPPEDLGSSDWSGIRAAYEAGRREVRPVEGGWRASNPGQRWRTHFDGRGFTLSPDEGDWSWGLELRAYGFAGHERIMTSPVCIEAEGHRVAYDWNGTLEEWYVNSARGLEHGYTIHERPSPGDGPLQFTLRVRGGLRAEVHEDRRGLDFVEQEGAAVVEYSGLAVFDADGLRLPARLEAIAGGILLSVDERGARYPLTVDPVAQQAYLKASNAEAGDYFGWAVAVSGNTVVVGAPLEDSAATGVNGDQSDNSASGSGAAYVFVRSGTTWTQQAYLKASNTEREPNPALADRFGTSVGISGDTAVIGAPLEDSGAIGVNGDQSDNSVMSSGAAYVFVRTGTTWRQQAYLKASNTGPGDVFGTTVSVSGDSVVVGSPGEDSVTTGVDGDQSDDTAMNAGAAFVFVRSGSDWSQQAYLKASNTETVDQFGTGDEFGTSVAISGETIVVGARGEDSIATGVDGDQSDNSAFNPGAAYVFVRSGTTWSQQAYLKASNTEDTFPVGEEFGNSVGVSGDTVVVGAHNEWSSATGVNGDQSDNGAQQSGAVYVFVRDGTTWSQQAYLKASNTGLGDSFGRSVAVSTDTVVVGAHVEDSGATGVNGDQSDDSSQFAGAAYVFVRSGTTWAQQAYLKASNTDAFDVFGRSVAVSGATVVIGADREDSAATGVSDPDDPGGDDDSAADAGAAYTYTLTDTLRAVETVRLGTPPNPAALLPGVTSGPVIGSTWDPVVDHTSFMPGAVVDLLGFFVGPANVSTIYGTLLCQGPLVVLPGAPGVPFRISISLDFSIVGISLCRQAASLDGVDAHLTNALDITIGGM